MKQLLSIAALIALASITTHGQTLSAKQAHAKLDGIVMGDRNVIDRATVSVTDQKVMPGGSIIQTIEVENGSHMQTYVATYAADGRLIDGMLVATGGDVGRLRAEANNEYVWFVPQGEATCLLTPDSVLVTRRYNMEMKPLGSSYIRHCATTTCRYAVKADGTFEQLPMTCENHQIEGPLDNDRHELPPTSRHKVKPSINTTSAQVMQLLYSPMSQADAAMEQWLALGASLNARSHMTGVPDSETRSHAYYASSIAPMLAQGDGRKMVWFYQHHGSGSTIEALALLLGGVNNLSAHLSTSEGTPFTNLLQQTAKRLSDKKARQWWKEALK